MKNQAQQLVQTIAMFQINQGEKTLDTSKQSVPAITSSKVDAKTNRRGPNRAKNVTRPLELGAKTGTDSNWESF